MSQSASNLLKLSGSDADSGVFSAEELSAAMPSPHGREGVVLAYGFKDRRDDSALLTELTAGAVECVTPVATSSGELTWTEHASGLAHSLAGMRLNLRRLPSSFSTFEMRSGSPSVPVEALALLDGRPWFIRCRVRDSWVYLLGIDEVPLPDLIVSSADQELPLISAAIAILTFVRRHFAEHAWFAPESFGNFVIDDPLLRPSYGFVRHEELAEHVKQARAAATIAFIPWNARRSAAPTAELYKGTTNLSICVHGYEHTAAEFSTTDVEDLRWRAESAMDAMRLASRAHGRAVRAGDGLSAGQILVADHRSAGQRGVPRGCELHVSRDGRQPGRAAQAPS